MLAEFRKKSTPEGRGEEVGKKETAVPFLAL